MLLRIVIPLLILSFLTACVTTDKHEPQPYMGNEPSQGNTAGIDLYNANKNVQKPQATSWGWLNN